MIDERVSTIQITTTEMTELFERLDQCSLFLDLTKKELASSQDQSEDKIKKKAAHQGHSLFTTKEDNTQNLITVIGHLTKKKEGIIKEIINLQKSYDEHKDKQETQDNKGGTDDHIRK
jgi:hypothetical protein